MDGSKDPDLTEAGKQRANRLEQLFHAARIDAIYSTNYRRTKSTIAPLATTKSLPIADYDPSTNNYLDTILSKYPGGTIVISGHSNTVPAAANYLLGRAEFKDFADDEYGNILVVEVQSKGKAKILWLKY